MNFFERRRMKALLDDCNYQLAAEIIQQRFGDNDDHYGLSSLIDQYVNNPCFETAIKLIERDSLFINYFTESKPEGLYSRLKSKKESAGRREAEAGAEAAVAPVAAAAERRSESLRDADVEKRPETKRGAAERRFEASRDVEWKEPDEPVPVNEKPAPAGRERMEPRSTKFPNVISTLMYDIEELQKQLKQLEAKISRARIEQNEQERMKYEQWAAVYKEGVKEFYEAVKLLQQAK